MIPTELLDLIRKHEGLRLSPYRCPAGKATIGYGHTGIDVSMSMAPITLEHAEVLLTVDAGKAIASALTNSPALADHPYKLTAIADFIFNLGAGRYRASTLRKRVDAEDWESAAIELQKWVWGGGKKLPGLIARRKAEADLLRGA